MESSPKYSNREMLHSKDEVDFVNNNSYYCNNDFDNNQMTTKKNELTGSGATHNQNNHNHFSSSNRRVNVAKPLANLKLDQPNEAVLIQENARSKQSDKSRCKNDSAESKKHNRKERLSLFSFSKRISQKTSVTNSSSTEPPNQPQCEEKVGTTKFAPLTHSCQPLVPIGTPPRQHKFVKSSSIARLLGNTYNAKKFEKEEQKRIGNHTKFHTYSGRRRANNSYLDRFKSYSKEDDDAHDTVKSSITLTINSRDAYGGSGSGGGGAGDGGHSELVSYAACHEERNEDLGAKAFRTISRGLGKLWWRRSHSVAISTPDPEFKVSYLGNVLTGWAKGEGCVEKQLNTLWRNYTQNSKPDVIMRIKVCASGLKATTRQHGLTEYWANRITHCCTPQNYPRVFCWIYRHEGRKLKHELRCHAVLCSKEKIVHDICNTLKDNLESALREFKREKILKQNARLSLANAAYDNPSLPRRKILLSVGGNNYRPPLERSKSAPKLMAIEEVIGEEDGDEAEDTNEPEMRSCCQRDSLYPAMTLGRRHCRRGHSIRRTGKLRTTFSDEPHQHATACCIPNKAKITTKEMTAPTECISIEQVDEVEEQRNSYSSDDSDDFQKLLKYNNYDSNAPLANELLPYFDMQLHKNTSASVGSLIELKEFQEPLSLVPIINSDPNADPESDYKPDINHDLENHVLGLRREGVCSDGEEDYLDADDMYFHQATILNMLHRNSMCKMANLSLSSNESSIETNSPALLPYRHHMQDSISSNASSTVTTVSAQEATSKRKPIGPDSDEGSISSGCETASTVTANQDDVSLHYRQNDEPPTYQHLPVALQDMQQLHLYNMLDAEPITAEEIYQRLESREQGRHNSDATTFSSSSSITLKMGGSSPASSQNVLNVVPSNTRACRGHRQSVQREQQLGDSDSECSDESGYVEYHAKDKRHLTNAQTAAQAIPQPPPKPMPRLLPPSSNMTAV